MLIIDCEIEKINSAVLFLRGLLVTMDPAPDSTAELPPLAIKKRNLTPEERRNIITLLLLVIKPDDPNMKLPRGALNLCADTQNVTRWTINRIWKRVLANYRNPNIRAFRSFPKKSGRPQKWNRDDVCSAVKELPLHQKRTIRSIATVLEIPKSSLFRMKQDKENTVIIPKSIAVKPLLSDMHKVQRIMFATSKLSEPNNHFHHFYNSIHVDEKWFFISEKQLRVYLAPDEEMSERNAQN